MSFFASGFGTFELFSLTPNPKEDNRSSLFPETDSRSQNDSSKRRFIMVKRGNEYGHLSKDEYEDAMNRESVDQSSGHNYRASEEVMKQRRVVKASR